MSQLILLSVLTVLFSWGLGKARLSKQTVLEHFLFLRAYVSLTRPNRGEIYLNNGRLVFRAGQFYRELPIKSGSIRSSSGKVLLYPSLYASPATLVIDGCRYTVNIQGSMRKWC